MTKSQLIPTKIAKHTDSRLFGVINKIKLPSENHTKQWRKGSDHADIFEHFHYLQA